MDNHPESEITSVKIVLGGRWGVGKTSLRRRYMGDARFKRNYLPTVGSDFSYKDIIIDRNKVRVLLWDLAGELRFRKFRSLYFQGASGAILVFDLTDRESFLSLDQWIDDLKMETQTDGIPIVILGNKSDLILDSSEMCVTQNELNTKIEEFEQVFDQTVPISYLEVSAMTGKNVEIAFKKIIYAGLEFKQQFNLAS